MKIKKKKIVIIMPQESLPVPAEKGGAIETLMTMIMNENEKNGKYVISIISRGERDKVIKYKNGICYQLEDYVPFLYTRTHINRGIDLLYCSRNIIYKKFFKRDDLKKPTKSAYLKKAYKICCTIKPDLIIFEGGLPNNIDLFEKKWKKKLVLHIHHRFKRTNEYITHVKYTITPSDYISEMWKNDYLENPGYIQTLKNCIDIDKFSKQISISEQINKRKTYGIDKDDFLIIYVGRLVPEKGVKELINAILDIPDNRIKLLVCGSDNFANGNSTEYANDVQKVIRKNSNRIIYTGYIDNSELWKIYQLGDIQVVPSICEEAAGLVVLEGLMSRLPLIITKSGGMVEYVDPDCAIIVEKDSSLVKNLEQAIIKLYENSDMRKRLSENGFRRAQKYSKEEYYKRFSDIIDEIEGE